MNKALFFSSCVSILFHTVFLFIPLYSPFIQNIDIDIIKAPASLELSLVHSVSSVEVKAEKIDKTLLEKKKGVEKFTGEEKGAATPKSIIGAITEQISSLMLNKPPRYPTLARVNGWQGEVLLLANVNVMGQVTQVNIVESSGYYILDQAAIKAVSQWRFRNIKKPLEVQIPIKFVLK